jgi:hypothetical protein
MNELVVCGENWCDRIQFQIRLRYGGDNIMLAEFYKTIDASEELGENISIPDYGPALYLSDSGELFCYMGIVSREGNGAHLNGWPYYLRGKSAKKSKQLIRGFYRLQAGCILLTNFLDDELYGEAKFKRLEHYIVSLPVASFQK